MFPPSPTREILWLLRGRTALQTGQREVAIDDLSKFVAYDPKNGEARYLLAMAYNSKRDYEKALQALQGVPEGGSFHYARAVALHGLGRKREASDEIDTAIRLGPPNPVLGQWQARIRAMPDKP